MSEEDWTAREAAARMGATRAEKGALCLCCLGDVHPGRSNASAPVFKCRHSRVARSFVELRPTIKCTRDGFLCDACAFLEFSDGGIECFEHVDHEKRAARVKTIEVRGLKDPGVVRWVMEKHRR